LAAKGAKKRAVAGKRSTKPRLPHAVLWMKRLEELANFKQKFGHCYASTQDKEHVTLGRWVQVQRHKRHRGELDAERIRQLDELGFVWDLCECLPRVTQRQHRRRLRWESMYNALVAYRQAHGHCPVVSSSRPRVTRLERWVSGQRSAKRHGKLSEDQVRRLEELDCLRSVRDDRWDERFAELLEYKKGHGNCDVPAKWRVNIRLARWVQMQKVRHREGRMRPGQTKRLEHIGFQF
jgi:hypothetical protein